MNVLRSGQSKHFIERNQGSHEVNQEESQKEPWDILSGAFARRSDPPDGKREETVLIPRRAFLTAGDGVHPEPLVAFELALRDAGIAAQNLVTVSSILPPGCPVLPRGEGERELTAGQILHVVMSRHQCQDPERLVGAGIGIARPQDPSRHGFVAEYAALDENEAQVGARSRDLAATMLGTSLGLGMDASTPGERAEMLRRSGLVASTDSICRVARSDPRGRWTCVVACCVLLTD